MTTNPSGDSEDNFERLLTHRDEIAKFVNSFTSERVQRKAFEAVVSTLGLADRATPDKSIMEPSGNVAPKPKPPVVEEGPEDATDGDGATTRRRRKTNTKKSFSVPRGLNWAPDGHPTLEAFVEEKQPRNNHEKNLLACYFLTHMMGIKVDTEHVLAVYQAAKWNAPAHPQTSLQGTASQHGWIDTADMKEIKVVWQGENYLQNKMPTEAKKSN